ncbi:zinc ABC transporter solute-binding protein [Streptomyces sp. SID4919]|uniref:zinc ABC transporter substrate-binding protein AztC n=1 Tax=unclassified Streptomyces TaxID=2593676 RepID=UPI000823E4E1|nr:MULTISPECIES: zinc ABC transporter substrate-binding protein AztC [unclassified Streptomyces]MYY10561.1 zinc ABC transporter solute-binding protein [Streptomyces sp. SID4919]SCK47455.1 zinc/manganese transport system substrate-binding protein [Streptomyces sp. AmelKG-E11A]
MTRRPRLPGRRTALAALLCAVTAATLTSCATERPDRPSVVVTTDILGDITREIAGDEAEVTVLMPTGTDPHSFGVSAPQAARLEQADLVVHNGLGLEENVQHHVRAAQDDGVPVLAVAPAVDPIDHQGGDGAGQPDPHFWTDPLRVRTAVTLIADRIAADVEGVDPGRVRANAARYGRDIDELGSEMRTAFGALPAERRQLVTDHHVFGYLAQRFGFTVVGAVIPAGSTLASPSASDLKSLADAIRAADVPAVFTGAARPDRLARVLRDETGLTVSVVPLHTESLTGPDGGAPTYLAMMRANTRAITAALTSR